MKVSIYARVSTKDKQEIDTQLNPVIEYCERNKMQVYKVYKDVGASGSKEDRSEFNKMLNDMRKGKFNSVAVYKLDRIGRSTQHLLRLFEEFNKRGIEFISVTQNIDTTTPEGRMFLRMLMIMAEYERELIVDRVTAGIKRAKEQGKHMGRPKLDIDCDKVLEYRSEGLSLRSIAKEMNVSLGSVQRCIKRGGKK